ncbi:serine/threonine-protein kinase M1 [Steccherinum ochraceum]|uniref:non-specific serine/threonine protein kinase n=1 Tax=Steccherinum ochraceum TaxID=92696 RepID=A0A4R0RIG3_9APHY|nr:serine/threonine-protein kinase M1 [Steccherinum ochraceum]
MAPEPPVPTPTPFPTFQKAPGVDGLPAHFYDFLTTLSTKIEEGAPKQPWVALLKTLSQNFFNVFPSPQEYAWHASHEIIKLTELSLKVLSQILSQPHGASVIMTDNLGKTLFASLVKACTLLDPWVDLSVPPESGYPSPEALRLQAVSTCVLLVRCVGSVPIIDAEVSSIASWELQRVALGACLGLCEELLALSPTSEFPIFATVLKIPHLSGKPSEEELEAKSDVLIESTSQVPSVLVLGIDIVIRALCPDLLSHWFVLDILLRSLNIARRTFDYFLSPACVTTDVRRAFAVAQLLSVIALAASSSDRFAELAEYMSSYALVRRLDEGPRSEWEQVDTQLLQILNKPLTAVPPFAQVQAVVSALRVHGVADSECQLQDAGLAYLRSKIPQLDEAPLRDLRVMLQSDARGFDDLLRAADERLDSLSSVSADAEMKVEPAPHPWRNRVRIIVQAIVEPDEISWMDDDESLSDSQYISRACNEVENRFDRPIYNPSAEARLALARHLADLPCALAHDSNVSCGAPGRALAISTIPVCLRVKTSILEGPKTEVTPTVRRVVFDAIGKSIRHHTMGFGGKRLEYAAEAIYMGMKDSDRGVRLSAGRALAELIKLYGTVGGGTARTEPLFKSLLRVCDSADFQLAETALITAGCIGKATTSEVLYRVTSCLISYIGHANPIVRGNAYMQLTAIVKHHKKSPYAFLSPHMSQIAPKLVSRISTQPTVLTEVCRFLSVSPSAFIGVTLNYTLRHVFADRDRRTLEIIRKELNSSLPDMFFNNAASILAYAFLLPPGQTHSVLSFVVDVLREVSGDTTIDIPNVVGCCVIDLLAELVIVMGEEDERAVERATQALLKVETAMGSYKSESRLRPSSGEGGIAALLKSYMLGIMTHMNELLRDTKVKNAVDIKKQVLRSFGPFVTVLGTAVNNLAPQLMATMQTMVAVGEFADVTLVSWYTFLTTLEIRDLGPYVGPSSASFVAYWHIFSLQARETAKRCLDYIVFEKGTQLAHHLSDIVDLSSIPHLAGTNARLEELRKGWTPAFKLDKLLERTASDNMTVALRSLGELKSFMASNDSFLRTLSSGDMFDPLVGRIMSTLLAAACRDSDGSEPLRRLAFDCIGMLGAVDPDRFEINTGDSRMIMLSNFTDENESVTFAIHLICDVLVGAFRSTSDIGHQSHLAYAIQELLKYCRFTVSLVSPGSTGGSVPLKVRTRWNNLPKHVMETVTPFLNSRYTLNLSHPANKPHPIYSSLETYREWIQCWADYLIGQTSEKARVVFEFFKSVVRNKDVGVAHHLLPHLVLNVLVSGDMTAAQNIRLELLAVLEDQVNSESKSTFDKKDLSAQTVFMLMDHLNKWVRVMRQEINGRRQDGRRGRAAGPTEAEEQLIRVDSILTSIDQNLTAKAALQCKAYGRALMCFEQQILALRSNGSTSDLHDYYERLHEIYSHLDEPDGMEGVSTLILSPSLEHQIRQHESTGKWTSAQSCWEVRLQQSPNDLQSHLGLLRCLRNIGHYDSMRTHVKGVLTRNPTWEDDLVGYQIESGWIVGDWDEVQASVQASTICTAPVLLAKVLLAMRAGDSAAVSDAVSRARQSLGAPITAAGPKGYKRTYDAVLNLHIVHELDLIHQGTIPSAQPNDRRMDILLRQLSTRLSSTLPAFRFREPVLSMRRTAFGLLEHNNAPSKEMISRSWLLSAKLARKAGYWQTAYSAVLHARHTSHPFAFLESAKLVKASGEPLRALQDLDNSLKISSTGGSEGPSRADTRNTEVIDLTADEPVDEMKQMKAKSLVLRARWMHDSDRYEHTKVLKVFQDATELYQKWESGWFHLGQFQDECFKGLSLADQMSRGTRMNLQTVRCYGKAIRFGSKYIYQTVPRLLTLWLDMGEHKEISQTDIYSRINKELAKVIQTVPTYKWYTAFPQIVSRVGHSNIAVYPLLARIIQNVISEYPKQALWLFTSVVKSTKQTRRERGTAILEKLKTSARGDVAKLIAASLGMTEALLALCDLNIREDRKTLSMQKDVPRLFKLSTSPLIVPLQESLTANLPPTSSTDSTHQPFPVDAPTFAKFYDEIEVMKSLAKPRKITIQGSNGQVYMFLGKPKDDLRKDARLMDFNAIINKLLKSNSESRRRQLYIRTYGVVTLNEECGFIQWVPNTIPLRPVFLKGYDERGVKAWGSEMQIAFNKIKECSDRDAAKLFREEVLSLFPPVFHEWFLETFPEPSAWLASRLSYSRTAAVMSMVGFILGLGDRHCENILLDVNNGDVVHVDFNCLFEKGKTLETPERVPFRLTQNVVDGLGITGPEGFFRIACEVTMQLLRDNKDSLMSVLDAFVHDPLVEWEDEKRKLEREAQRRNSNSNKNNVVRASVDLRHLAKNALNPIEKKLKGIYSTGKEKMEREISTSSLVQILIQEAMDESNLAKMYPGWAPWH